LLEEKFVLNTAYMMFLVVFVVFGDTGLEEVQPKYALENE